MFHRHALILLVLQGACDGQHGDAHRDNHSIDNEDYELDEKAFARHVRGRSIPVVGWGKQITGAHAAGMLEPPQLHQDEVQNKQEGRDEPEDRGRDRELLVVEALGPEVQRVPENFEDSAYRPDLKHLVEARGDVSACADRHRSVSEVVRVARSFLALVYKRIVRECDSLRYENQVEYVVAEQTDVASGLVGTALLDRIFIILMHLSELRPQKDWDVVLLVVI